MNLFALFSTPKHTDRHTEARYYAATRAERKLAHRRAVDRQLELAVAVSTLTPEQRTAAKMRGGVRS